jgi:hypothetical protein
MTTKRSSRPPRSPAPPKPSVFIGSSSEQLPTARAVKELLRPELESTIWDEGVFGFGNAFLEDLLKAVEAYDFAVFVFAPDDVTTVRAKRVASVRDNVVFELGLFMGQLGRHRTFWLVPTGKEEPAVPSDLRGINRADFDTTRAKSAASLALVCKKIKEQMRKQGRRGAGLYEEIETPRVLCGASVQWAQFGFDGDVAALESVFPGRVIVHKALRGADLAGLLTKGEWPIVHLVCYADPRLGDLVFSSVDITDERVVRVPEGAARLSPDGLAALCQQAKVKLLVLATCDSVATAAGLVRTTRVVASTTLVTGPEVETWARLFYDQLAQGKPLTQAFELTKGVTDIPLVLMTALKDLRMRV